MTVEDKALETMRLYLISMVADILQTSDKSARVAIGAAANVIFGATFATSVTGAVGAFGTAGTGAAIASLAGAAKSTAALYSIGGLVGGGVAAGYSAAGDEGSSWQAPQRLLTFGQQPGSRTALPSSWSFHR